MTLLPSKWCERCDEYHPDHQHLPRWSVEPYRGLTGVARPIHAYTASQAARRWAECEAGESESSWQTLTEGGGVKVTVTSIETGDARLFDVMGELVSRYLVTAVDESDS